MSAPVPSLSLSASTPSAAARIGAASSNTSTSNVTTSDTRGTRERCASGDESASASVVSGRSAAATGRGAAVGDALALVPLLPAAVFGGSCKDSQGAVHGTVGGRVWE